jgi:hypothetical protein
LSTFNASLDFGGVKSPLLAKEKLVYSKLLSNFAGNFHQLANLLTIYFKKPEKLFPSTKHFT